MSGVSSAEFLLLLVIGLIVLGPKRLPEIANKIGGFVGQARRMTRVMKRQLEEELSLDQNPGIRPPDIAQRTAPSAAPDPADPAYDIDEPVPHVPKDDDTYSPLHGEDEEDDDEGAGKTEQSA